MRSLLLLPLILLSVTLISTAAKAAPQLLGLVASKEPIPLSCRGAICVAELSSFCLQRERPVPPAGTIYKVLRDDAITLILRAADGREIRVPANRHAHFASQRNYAAVAISVPTDTLTQLGADTVAVEISDGVTLIPDPVAGDPSPQSDADIAFATAARQGAGMQIVDRDDGAAAAGILNGIVNRLSPDAHGQVTPRQSLWHAAVGTKHSTPAARQAHALYQACHEGLLHDNDAKLRWCLQLRHDALLMKLNSGYWEAVRTGS